MEKNKNKITILPDGSCFAVIPMDECVDFIDKYFNPQRKSTKIIKKFVKNKKDKDKFSFFISKNNFNKEK